MTAQDNPEALSFDQFLHRVLLGVAEGESGLWVAEWEINGLMGTTEQPHHRAAAMGLLAMFYHRGWLELLRSTDGGRELSPLAEGEDPLDLIYDPKWYEPDELGDEVIYYIATDAGYHEGMIKGPAPKPDVEGAPQGNT
jgi:hypothetical protein